MAKVAVVLAGSGVKDGSEIHESTLALLHLDEAGAEISCFAPDKPMAHVINHAAGVEMAGESRNVLVESARISRGDIAPLSTLNAADFDALVIPGGFGAAKNLCDYAFKGPEMTVDPEVKRVVLDFHNAGKVKTFICITPTIAARVFSDEGIKVRVTVGTGTADAPNITAMGAEHVDAQVNEVVIDEDNKIISTPAYQLGPSIKDVNAGIKQAILETMKFVEAAAVA